MHANNQLQHKKLMKSFIYILLVGLTISCVITPSKNQAKKENANQIKLAAYNVEFSKNASAKEIGEQLKNHDFDVICFSEAPGGNWTEEVGSVIDLNHVVVGKYSTAGHKDKYKTIASRIPLFDYEEVLMGDTLHSATRVKIMVNNTEMVIYAVHFPFAAKDHPQPVIDKVTHKIQTLVNFLKVRQHEEITVAAGDFNFIPSNADSLNPYHQMFMDIGLDLSWKELGIDCTTRNTHNAFKPEDDGRGNVIDHIMYNSEKMKALDGNILETEKHLSDHKLVWALLEVK